MSNNDIKPFNKNVLNSNLIRNDIDNCTTITKDLVVTGTITSGTWTPSIGDGTSNFSLSSAVGEWTKIGNQYFINCTVVWTSIGSASGNIRVSLPFAIGSNRLSASIGFTSGITYSTQLVLSGDNGDSSISLYQLVSGGDAGNLTDFEFNETGQLQFNCQYYV